MEIINKYFPDLSEKQINQFAQLQDLYRNWNSKINVISRKDIDELYERHILHSLAISKVIKFKDNTKLLDVGTGGGFPGIPLAILYPECDFHLVDSIGKKIIVVKEVAKAIGLNNVRTDHERAEKLKENYDFIISRAVTAFPAFYNWVRNKINKISLNDLPNGILYLKGGDLSEELKNFKSRITEHNISVFFDEPFFETKKVIYMPI